MSFFQTADENFWYSLTDFDHASESATFEIRKSIMVPKWLTCGMSTNLPRYRPKTKSEKYGLRSELVLKIYNMFVLVSF